MNKVKFTDIKKNERLETRVTKTSNQIARFNPKLGYHSLRVAFVLELLSFNPIIR